MAKSNDWMKIKYTAKECYKEDFLLSTVARAMYLATFADEHRVLWKYSKKHKEKINIDPTNFHTTLGLSFEAALKFFDEIYWSGMARMSDYYCELIIDDCYWGDYTGVREMYVNRDTMRELYEHAGLRKHNSLGALIRMVPFLDPETNILCESSFEDGEELKPMSFTNFRKFLGYDWDKGNTLLKHLNSFMITSETGEKICPIQFSENNEQIFISPLLFRAKIDD